MCSASVLLDHRFEDAESKGSEGNTYLGHDFHSLMIHSRYVSTAWASHLLSLFESI